ncbi:5-methylcytosine-specific restriction enzyme A [Sinomicrobium oceani]|uniref:5-methylcytosine-specific restriction enzyme A n=2 Tax=Sinomicrobium oceani TaxID=1150368 RepID=A0A1K1RWI2_9FLAO|nr:5-methylcytosine-specific restriction enzyme A [Sinomicrobium oceani]
MPTISRSKFQSTIDVMSNLENILQEPLENYQIEKSKSFAGNALAHKFRHDYPAAIENLLIDKTRYKVIGSPGKGNWTDCPWIAILDTLITETAQKGYYPVFLFKSDMTGVYLSLNQGVTDVIENYKREAKSVLKLRAEDFRAKLNYNDAEYSTEINLESKTINARHYQAGNILAKYYPKDNLPTETALKKDIKTFLEFYEALAYSDTSFSSHIEQSHFETKQIRLHWRIERNTSLSKKVKKLKGYTCEACNMNFVDKYGSLGEQYIEAHHLRPISELEIGKVKIDIENDFAVLCSNCHSMIHRMDDPSDLEGLRDCIKKS